MAEQDRAEAIKRWTNRRVSCKFLHCSNSFDGVTVEYERWSVANDCPVFSVKLDRQVKPVCGVCCFETALDSIVGSWQFCIPIQVNDIADADEATSERK
jgi:hypothetical protein